MSHYHHSYQRMHDLDLCLARHLDRPPVIFEIGSRRDPANRNQDPRYYFRAYAQCASNSSQSSMGRDRH